MEEKKYIAIDLKSFYASVECVELGDGFNPLTTNLVVADKSRSSKTICLAVSPSLKAYGIPGRARLFEVEQRVREINFKRKAKAPQHVFTGKSFYSNELEANPSLELDFIIARPRMAMYLEYSARIFEIYLKYISPDDIHSYSIDEVFIDATPYLKNLGVTARALAYRIVTDILNETKITATVGIGTNLYLAKVAMDIMAKKMPADKDGVRIAELDELTYRKALWSHTPITDFWRVGRGYAKKLREHGLYTMGDIARCSVGKSHEYHNEDLLYKLFGVNAQLLIDHAWGWEPCTMEAIKKYRPATNSISSGQVLQSAYSHEMARLIVWEMTDVLVLDLVEKGLVTNQLVLDVGYDIDNMNATNSPTGEKYAGDIHIDHYGRRVPKPAHGTVKLAQHTSSTKIIVKAMMDLFEEITDSKLLVRRVTVTANNVVGEDFLKKEQEKPEQLDLFTDYEQVALERSQAEKEEKREKSLQHTVLNIKHKYGKNAILKGANLQAGAMTIERNQQIGGHRA